jgi:putative Mg2+ transporter-C (MgtC) family protein
MLLLTDFIFRLLVAFVMGSLIGVERHWRQRRAGLRTNTLVAMGSALFIMLSAKITGDASPSRIAAQIVSGIGFLGAGVIMKEGLNVRGLNTAATLWCSAAVGSLAGMGFWAESTVATLAVLGAHLVLRPVGQRINRHSAPDSASVTQYLFRLTCRPEAENHIRVLLLHTLSGSSLQLRSLESTHDELTQHTRIAARILASGNQEPLIERIASLLSLEGGVSSIKWRIIDINEE